ncbi:hypothetical protein ACH5RR_036859 [Cinchona calisaya]|uniref:Uncharacterized protein n=1 Tax=Cinchona calisaya TaxID=153742 RepID=A0ABD2Y894_9GENT
METIVLINRNALVNCFSIMYYLPICAPPFSLVPSFSSLIIVVIVLLLLLLLCFWLEPSVLIGYELGLAPNCVKWVKYMKMRLFEISWFLVVAFIAGNALSH